MRPIIHPEIVDVPIETMLHALSDPARVAIMADIVKQDCSQNCSMFLHVTDRPIPKSTLSQHFKILREAGLIRSERRGVEVHNTSRCSEVDAHYPGLIASIVNAHAIQHADRTRMKKSKTRPR